MIHANLQIYHGDFTTHVVMSNSLHREILETGAVTNEVLVHLIPVEYLCGSASEGPKIDTIVMVYHDGEFKQTKKQKLLEEFLKKAWGPGFPFLIRFFDFSTPKGG